MSRPAAMAEIHSAHAKPPATIQKVTMLPMPKTSQATNARAAGATKNPVVTTSIVDNPVLKQKMDFSTGRHQGAVHIPETIWPFGQKDSAALRMKRPMKKATYQAATQATGISIHLSAFMICCPTFEVWHGGKKDVQSEANLGTLSAVATTDLFCLLGGERFEHNEL